MAKATPVTAADKAPAEPAQAEVVKMPEAKQPDAPKQRGAVAEVASKEDFKALEALKAEAEAAGKKATFMGNAVAVDH